MRKRLKKALTFVTAMAMVFSMNAAVWAGDDIVLDGGGDPNAALIKTIDPGTKGAYKYIGWAYVGDCSSDYKYLKITYKGDSTSLEEVRLELVEPDGDPNGPGYLQKIIWFGDNEEGTFQTIDGGMVPAPTDKEQTAIIDLEKSGYDLSHGIRAFHIHTTPGKGKVTFTDARLMTSIPSDAKGSGSSSTSTSGKDSKSSSSSSTDTNSSSTSTNSKSEDADTNSSSDKTGNQTTGGGSTSAPKTGSTTYPIAVALGGIIVAGGALVVSRKFKEEN